MEYLLIGTLLGSIITSEHKDREACEGRAVMLREAKASVQCLQKHITALNFGYSIGPGGTVSTSRACYQSTAGLVCP